jgi:hypothetical protein
MKRSDIFWPVTGALLISISLPLLLLVGGSYLNDKLANRRMNANAEKHLNIKPALPHITFDMSKRYDITLVRQNVSTEIKDCVVLGNAKRIPDSYSAIENLLSDALVLELPDKSRAIIQRLDILVVKESSPAIKSGA